MYELILHSQIPFTRHKQVQQMLAGVTATQPVAISEQVLLFQQLKSAESGATNSKKGALTGQNAAVQRLRYHKLIRSTTNPSQPGPWQLVIEETPDAGIKDVNARIVTEKHDLTDEELERFRMGEGWYKLTNTYTIIGSRFVQENIVIRLFRLLVPKIPDHSIDLENPTAAPLATLEDLDYVDPSDAFVLEALIRTIDNPSPALRERATEELLKLAKLLEGAVDLRVVERLALDTEVKRG